MNYKLIVLPEAEDNFASIIDNIRIHQGQRQADAFSRDFGKQVARIIRHPYSFSLYYEEPMASRGVRRALIKKYYRLFYTVDDDQGVVRVIGIYHSARDLGELVAD